MSDFYRVAKAQYGASGLELDAAELARINQHTLRAMQSEELFAFKVTLCDNEVDRDCEAFDAAAIQKLARLFNGKPIISDHQPRASNQCARIYAAQAIEETGKTTSQGEAYVRLEARCYMPRNEDTKEQIALIESGILKETSVGCAMGKMTCSICGNQYFSAECAHEKRKKYDGKLCVVRLQDPVDGYEVSFVAVPSQTTAGVTKGVETPERFAAELEAIGGMLKEIIATVKGLVNGAAPPPPQPTTAEPTQQESYPDPEIGELIRSANALAKQYCEKETC